MTSNNDNQRQENERKWIVITGEAIAKKKKYERIFQSYIGILQYIVFFKESIWYP